MKITSARSVKGTVRVPGDKSVSHRAVMLTALAKGTSTIENFSPGEDCASTIRCFRSLGVTIDDSAERIEVHGIGRSDLRQPTEALDCGNSGTTMRLLVGILAGQPFESVLTGDDSLRKRPMGRVIEPLTRMGAEIASEDGFAPLRIHGGSLKGIEYLTPVASAQIKSCVLLAALFADGPTSVIEATISRDHTERMLRALGLDVIETSADGRHTVGVNGPVVPDAASIVVPGDISSAAFFMVAAACLEGSELFLEGVGVNPTRYAIVDILRRCGAEIDVHEKAGEWEPTADIVIRGGLTAQDSPIDLSGDVIASVIDEVPILAVLGTKLKHGMVVRGARELRVKESDRIMAIVRNLQKMGADVDEFDDGFRIGPSRLSGADIETFGDHRIAMAFAVAGLLAAGPTEISDHECADISYPGFFNELDRVAVR